MSHTPGPWHAAQARSKIQPIDGYWLITAANGVQVADLFGLTGECDDDGDDKHISNEESEANAHLIESAPALLKALRKILHNEEYCGSPHSASADIARAAIRQARAGEEER